MNEDDAKTLAARLIEAEQSSRAGIPGAEIPGDRVLERLLIEDRKFEERVRRIALFSWALSLVCLVTVVFALTVAGPREGTALDLARAVLALFGIVGMISLLAAVVSSLSWLFRSRTPTLRAIERRLAALEAMLVSRRGP